MFVKKKQDVVLHAEQCTEAGTLVDDRDVLQPYVKGDWILITNDGCKWPVSDVYFKEVYEEVKE